jgi:hypothetical protein
VATSGSLPKLPEIGLCGHYGLLPNSRLYGKKSGPGAVSYKGRLREVTS